MIFHNTIIINLEGLLVGTEVEIDNIIPNLLSQNRHYNFNGIVDKMRITLLWAQ